MAIEKKEIQMRFRFSARDFSIIGLTILALLVVSTGIFPVNANEQLVRDNVRGFPGTFIERRKVGDERIINLAERGDYKGLSTEEALTTPNALTISLKNGNYFWTSNNNVPLIKTEREYVTVNGGKAKYSVFVSPDGYGMITIRHDDPEKIICDFRPGANYYEYKINEYGLLDTYVGNTVPPLFPQTPEGWCKLNRNINRKYRK